MTDKPNIEDFDDEKLQVELEKRGMLVFKDEADALRSLDNDDMADHLENAGYQVWDEDENPLASGELDEALARFRRREYAECLIWLERALPADFSGLSDMGRRL